MQVKVYLYIEAAGSYAASDGRIMPILIPQLVILIPSYVFLEATLGLFNVTSIYPIWGRIIYEALQYGGIYGPGFWVLELIGLLLLTGVAFVMLDFALEWSLNPKLNYE